MSVSGRLPVDRGVLFVGRQMDDYLPTKKASTLFAVPQL